MPEPWTECRDRLRVECRAVDSGYQDDVWNNNPHKRISLATAPLEVLEKVPKNKKVCYLEQISAVTEIDGENR